MPGKTREIPHDKWVEFLNGFSRQHEGWLSTLEVLGSETGAQIEARDQPLTGVAADVYDNGEEVISILLGGKAGDHVAHIIRTPSHVSLKETDEGAHEALQIQSQEGPTTLLRFRSPMPTEALDGVILDR